MWSLQSKNFLSWTSKSEATKFRFGMSYPYRGSAIWGSTVWESSILDATVRGHHIGLRDVSSRPEVLYLEVYSLRV